MQIRTAYRCRFRRQTEELWVAMNVCPFAPAIDPPDRFLPTALALTPQFGKVALRRRLRGFLALPAPLGLRLAVSATGGARLRPHYQDCQKCVINSPIDAPTRKRKSHPKWDAICVFGADEQIRTAYLLITNEVLYRLSYISAATNIIAKPAVHCKC